MSDHIKIGRQDAVLEVTFARPEKKNALSNSMYAAARDALNAAQEDDAVRAVLFSAEGDTFTAGNDLSDFARADREPPLAHSFVQAIVKAEKPLLAAVPGLAVGVGATMLLHCDLVFVAETARISAPFVNLGLVPEAGSSLLLPARIGHVRAFAMFALGEALSGTEAVALGLANKALPAADVREAALAAAHRLAEKPLGSVMATKRLMRGLAGLSDHVQAESAIFAERLRGPEAREAFTAFTERRTPDFRALAASTTHTPRE